MIVKSSPRFFVTEAAIMDSRGEVLANGTVKYLKLDVDKIAENATVHEEMCYLAEDGVEEINFEG